MGEPNQDLELIVRGTEEIIKLEDLEQTAAVWAAQKAYQREQQRSTDALINDRVYEDLGTDEELYAYKRSKAREVLQLQADAFLSQQSRKRQPGSPLPSPDLRAQRRLHDVLHPFGLRLDGDFLVEINLFRFRQFKEIGN